MRWAALFHPFFTVFSAVPLVAICNTFNMTEKLPISSFFSWRYLSKVTKKNGMMEKNSHFGGHKSSMDCESSQGICALTHLMLWLSKKRQSYKKKIGVFHVNCQFFFHLPQSRVCIFVGPKKAKNQVALFS